MAERLQRFVDDTLWPRLKEPLAEIIIHLAVSFLSILSISFIEFVLYVAKLDGKVIPLSGLLCQRLGFNAEVTLGDLMFFIEVLAATVIIVIGIVRAIIVLVRS